jgi:peptidoglycan/xylan/chitin deacetylase (PgdA/CDA1 family)
VVLCYHGVGHPDPLAANGYLQVEPDAFRSQLDLLRDAGFEFATVAELLERVEDGRPPAGFAALTFDDGMVDNHALVRPLLQERGLTATFFVTSGLVGLPNPWLSAGSEARMMTVDELRDLAAAGFEIGAHSVTHSDMSTLDYDACLREASESRRFLEAELGVDVRSFAYPYCAHSPTASAAVRAAGFTAAVACGDSSAWTPFELPRVVVRGGDGISTFALRLLAFRTLGGPLGAALRRRAREFRYGLPVLAQAAPWV